MCAKNMGKFQFKCKCTIVKLRGEKIPLPMDKYKKQIL